MKQNPLIDFLCYFVLIFIQLSSILKQAESSSIEPCLSAQAINLALITDPSIRIPVDCQCSNSDLICINLQIYNASSDASSLTLPSLSVLFQKDFSSLYYILPKQRFSFFGYKYMVSESFRDVKFVNEDDGMTSFTNQTLFIDFIEGNFFPTGTFSNFGNLKKYAFKDWPRIFINIVVNEDNPLYMMRSSVSNMSIETLSFNYAKAYMSMPFFTYSLSDSKIKNLIFKNSKGFTGFTECDYPSLARKNKLGIEVENLLIDQCPNFVLTDSAIPPFDKLFAISITSSNVRKIPNYSFINFRSLASLNLNGNALTEITNESFNGVENQLVYLDLSHNPITSLDWKIFLDFNRIRLLDLSYTNITDMQTGIDKIWPNSNDLSIINLAGYSFETLSICSFDSNPLGKRLDFSKTLIQLDQNQECNCFVFWIYKEYRMNPDNNPLYWIATNSTPSCYKNLYYSNQNSPGFQEIIRREGECDFNFIENTLCAIPIVPTNPTIETNRPTIPTPFTQFPTDPSVITQFPTQPTPFTQFPTDPSVITQFPTQSTPFTQFPTDPTSSTLLPTDFTTKDTTQVTFVSQSSSTQFTPTPQVSTQPTQETNTTVIILPTTSSQIIVTSQTTQSTTGSSITTTPDPAFTQQPIISTNSTEFSNTTIINDGRYLTEPATILIGVLSAIAFLLLLAMFCLVLFCCARRRRNLYRV